MNIVQFVIKLPVHWLNQYRPEWHWGQRPWIQINNHNALRKYVFHLSVLHDGLLYLAQKGTRIPLALYIQFCLSYGPVYTHDVQCTMSVDLSCLRVSVLWAVPLIVWLFIGCCDCNGLFQVYTPEYIYIVLFFIQGCELSKVKKSWKMGSGPGSPSPSLPLPLAPWTSWMFNFGGYLQTLHIHTNKKRFHLLNIIIVMECLYLCDYTLWPVKYNKNVNKSPVSSHTCT